MNKWYVYIIRDLLFISLICIIYNQNINLTKQNETMRMYIGRYERIQTLFDYKDPTINKEAFDEVVNRTRIDSRVLISLRYQENGGEGLENGVQRPPVRITKYWNNPQTWNMAASADIVNEELNKFVFNDPDLTKRFVIERLGPRYNDLNTESWIKSFLNQLMKHQVLINDGSNDVVQSYKKKRSYKSHSQK